MRGRSILVALVLTATSAGAHAQGSPSPSASAATPGAWVTVTLGTALERSCIFRLAAGSNDGVTLMTTSFPIQATTDTASPGTDVRSRAALWSVPTGRGWEDGAALVERPVLAMDGTPLDATSWSGRDLVPFDDGMIALGQSWAPATLDYGAPIVLQAMSDGPWQVIVQDLPADLLIATAIVNGDRIYVAGRSGATSPTDEPPRLFASADGRRWDDLGVTGAAGAATSIVVGPDGTILLTGPRTSDTGGSVGTWTRTPDGTWHDAPIPTGLQAPLVRSPIATGSGYLLSVTGYGQAITGELWRSADGVAWERQPAEATPGVVGSLLIVPGGIEATVFRVHPDPADPGSGSIGTVLGHAPDGVVWTVDADEVPAELYPPVALPNGSLLAAACNLEVMNSDDPDAMPASLWLHRRV